MANTITQTTLLGGGADKNIVRRIHIISDGSEETDLVIYDNSTLVNNVLKGRIDYIYAMGNDCVCRFEWDATTDVPACSVNPATHTYTDFRQFGGLNNPGGTGATGDLLLTTNTLDAGDEVTLIIGISQN
jgi:adhesin HecA-like repeat protein